MKYETVKKKLTTRQLQALKTKNKIFDIAMSLMSKQGFESVNIEDICKAADVSIGTFYNYYKSKNEVFYEIYSRADHFFVEKVNDKLNMKGSPEAILKYFDYYALYCEKTGVSIMTQMMNAGNRNFIKKGRYMQVLLIELLNNGINAGLFKSEKSAEELCDCFFMIARGILFDWCLHEGQYDLRKRMKECIAPFLP